MPGIQVSFYMLHNMYTSILLDSNAAAESRVYDFVTHVDKKRFMPRTFRCKAVMRTTLKDEV